MYFEVSLTCKPHFKPSKEAKTSSYLIGMMHHCALRLFGGFTHLGLACGLYGLMPLLGAARLLHFPFCFQVSKVTFRPGIMHSDGRMFPGYLGRRRRNEGKKRA